MEKEMRKNQQQNCIRMQVYSISPIINSVTHLMVALNVPSDDTQWVLEELRDVDHGPSESSLKPILGAMERTAAFWNWSEG